MLTWAMARPLRTIGAAAALLLALFGSAGDAQQGQSAPQPEKTEPPPPTPQQPVFRAGINYVRVDVIVTDKSGNPVPDLNAGDFEVTEDKKKDSPPHKKPEAGIQALAQAIALDSLQYHINIVLPETRDQGVYDAIFRSLREHLGTRHG